MSRSVRVLVIDDHPDDRALTALALRAGLTGFEIEEVGDAMVMAERLVRPDLAAVVCEARLGWSTGLEVLETTKRMRPECAVVIFTCCGDERLAGEGIRRGLDGYVVKSSAGYLALAATVREAVERAERRVAATGPAEGGDLAERAAALVRSNAELQQFSYAISHDLQEPLHLISRYAQLVAERYGGKLDLDAQRYLAHVMTSAARMQAMINDVLEYARVATRGRDFQPVSSEGLVVEAVANLRLTIDESDADVTWHDLPTVVVDPGQMVQLFQNLIGNAVKFRGRERPRVQVSAVETDDAWVFAVLDNGIGIAEEALERIFGMFQRLHTAEEFPGTGIGLAICKRIVERHGGQIWATSKPGEGSTFYFTLPKRPAQAGRDGQGHDGGEHGERRAARLAR